MRRTRRKPLTSTMSNLRDILRSPKVQLLFLLATLAGVGAARNPRPALLLVQLGVAVASAVLAEWAFFGPVSPTYLHSAAVSGMLVGMILAPGASLELLWLAAVVAIASKKLMMIRPGRHIFNPAALGLAVVMLLFGNHLTWWGYSSPVVVVVGAGLIAGTVLLHSRPICRRDMRRDPAEWMTAQ